MRCALFALTSVISLAACGQRDPVPSAPPASANTPTGQAPSMNSFHSFTAIPLGGTEPVALSKYKGRVLLVANTAAHCGYTPQYGPLGEVDRKYKARGLDVLGFVSDDFGHQAGTTDEVKACSVEYKATFDQFAEVHVKKGEGQHPLFAWLTSQAEFPGEVKWNFSKFLIGRSGELLGRWASGPTPDGPEITQAIEKALGQ